MNSKEKSMGFFTRKEKTIFSKAQKEELKTLRARVKVLEESYEKNRSNDIKKELDDCLYKIHSIKEESAIYVGYKAVWDLKEIDDLIDKLIHLKDTRDLITKDVENESDEVPRAAKEHNLMDALSIQDIQDIVYNAKLQKETVSIDELLEAYLYYYDNDAFIEWKL